MRYYITSTDPRHVEVLKEITAQAANRYRFFKEKVEALGFDELGMHPFSVPMFFCKRCQEENPPRVGPSLADFKGGERICENGVYYFKYTVRGRGKKFYDTLCEGAPAIPDELKGANSYRRPTIDTVFAARLGLPDGVFSGRSINYASTYLLHGKTMVACSLPYRDDDSTEAAPVVIPDGFVEVTERALHAEIKKHNDALQAAS
ncbi:hypothetical protein FHR70_000670 [Microvirga lupini]|uniref:Uncharacterized protein n=1 Tax=Microvirga lupini TaxID=420324 RepID=A0A7W4YUQ6_9HYPH|nr:hypothetical protein [Microvirga lupini]MBB3017630.1 hypothetical protein [Microvirga lupini]